MDGTREDGSSYLGLRKGAWTREEDDLLRHCVNIHGEGNWHQVPSKAGLKRCRKSCRLRWLNYLKPNIKRGGFSDDETDLIFRLHKLLGNRWSLIAGRLLGRTGNDVKNYWNTRLRVNRRNQNHKSPESTKSTVIRPRPRTFSKSLYTPKNKATHFESCSEVEENVGRLTQPSPATTENEIDWLKTFLDDMDCTAVERRTSDSHCLEFEKDHFITNFWVEGLTQDITPTRTPLSINEEEATDDMDLCFNTEVWNPSNEE